MFSEKTVVYLSCDNTRSLTSTVKGHTQITIKDTMYWSGLHNPNYKSPEQQEKERQLKKHKATCEKNRKKRKDKRKKK